jgi:Kelch motif
MPHNLANVGSLVKHLRLLISALLLTTAGCASQYWQFVGHMTLPRVGHTATLLNDGRVLVVGGYNKDSGVLASAEIFDPITQTWSLTGSMHIARLKHTATLLPDGTVLVVGGLQNVGSSPLHGTNTAERDDPASGTWTFVKAMSTPRAFHLSSILPDGTVVVVGGGPTGNRDDQLSAERFYPDRNSWSPRAPHSSLIRAEPRLS